MYDSKPSLIGSIGAVILANIALAIVTAILSFGALIPLSEALNIEYTEARGYPAGLIAMMIVAFVILFVCAVCFCSFFMSLITGTSVTIGEAALAVIAGVVLGSIISLLAGGGLEIISSLVSVFVVALILREKAG